MSKTTTRLLLKHLPKPTPSHFLSHTHKTHFSSSNFSQNPFSNFQQNSLFNPKSLQNPLTKVVQRPDLSLTPPFLGSRFINFKAPELLGTKLFNPLKANNYAKNVVSKPVNNGFVGFRFINFKASELLGTKFNPLKSNSNATKYAKSVAKKPVNAIGDVVSRYRGAVGLQIEAFWKRNSLVLWGAGGLMVCILLWRVMFGIANTFVGLSEGMAKYGFLALSSAIVAFAGLYLRSRFSINPDKVYRIAMRTLNTDAGILEVMGAPLSGTDLRAYVMSGGGVALRKFKPGFRGKRCFLIFPIRGSERKGLVSVEVKNRKGQYDIKLLAVDIPMISGPDQRIFLIGNEEEYRVGGGLISELRDPVIKAMAAVKEFEDRDEREEEEDAEREVQEAERKHQEEIERIDR